LLCARLAMLLAVFALALGPAWCELFCSDDCCADHSQCSACAENQLPASAQDEPLAVVPQPFAVTVWEIPSGSSVAISQTHLLTTTRGPPAASLNHGC
jgi:hypothetical protein